MKAIIRYFDVGNAPSGNNSLPLLDFNIRGAPHKRQVRAVLQRYREDLYDLANRRWGIELPIDYPVDVNALFINPNSPDLDHTMEALYMALDGKTLKGPSILTDDRWIQGFNCKKYYPNDPTKRDGAR